MNKTAAVLYSGGKDSTYTIQRLRERGFRVVCLITITSENPDSYMFHTASIGITDLASKALDLPLIRGQTRGEKESELVDMKSSVVEARRQFHFDVLGCGGLASLYQKTRIEKIARECGLESEAPLWELDQFAYLDTLLSNNYRFILTSVSAEGLGKEWLGREIDQSAAEELKSLSKKNRFNAALEGGEGESLVLDCPLYQKSRIKITHSSVTWKGFRGVLNIEEVELEPKHNSDSGPQV